MRDFFNIKYPQSCFISDQQRIHIIIVLYMNIHDKKEYIIKTYNKHKMINEICVCNKMSGKFNILFPCEHISHTKCIKILNGIK